MSKFPRDVDNLIVLTEPLFEQDADAGREQEVTREELLMLGLYPMLLLGFRGVGSLAAHDFRNWR